ncbi:MAG: hypothetical protein KatS3mg068_0074 [Candidatus Sericytochromatia bacterium]|nr:MAG: hypothetical protein KatS3mg068_0074 [Candidatus Sericytochromatia bacterium]
MKKVFLLLFIFLNSCVVDPDLIINLGKEKSNSSSDSSLLIGGKTLRQQLNLKLTKLDLEEFQEIDMNNYIDIKNSALSLNDIVWSSKNNDIALINANTGKLRAVKEGKTLISVSLKNNKDIFAVIELTVLKKKLVSHIQIIPSSLKLKIGESKILKAEVYLVDNQINSNVSWASSDNTIAIVDQSGKVTAIKEGKVTITATYNLDNNYKAISILEVSN